jgi:hypothetical protein
MEASRVARWSKVPPFLALELPTWTAGPFNQGFAGPVSGFCRFDDGR